MKILLVCRGYASSGGSAARWNSIANYLSVKNRVFVVTNLSSQAVSEKVKNRAIHILSSPVKPRLTSIPFFSLLNIILSFYCLLRVLSRIAADITIVTIPELEEGIACAIVSKMYRKRFVMDVRDWIVQDHVRFVYPLFPRLIQKIVRLTLSKFLLWSLNSADCVVTVTSTLKKFMLSEGVKAPIHVVPNGAETSSFYPTDDESKSKLKEAMGFKNSYVILYAGSMNLDYYPMDVIFEAFQIVNRAFSNARLALCGSADRRTKNVLLKQGKNVSYFGVLPRKEVARLMQASDIGVISMDVRESTICALTTKFFEYLASGLPVIAACPKNGEMDVLIASEHIGYAVPSGDYRSMAEKIIFLINRDQDREICAKNGVKLVTTKFDRRKLAESYQNILFDVMKT